MPTYEPALLDQIRVGLDIVDLVSRYVTLKRAGTNWKGLCPFHAEKTPSFMVNPKKGIFHCFGCGAGGDAFGFVMRQDRLSFPEAVRALANTAGVTLPEKERSPSEESGREELFKVMELAARFYADALAKPEGAPARQYLDGRGIDTGIARRFGLGWAPESWDALLTVMKAERLAMEPLVVAGLVVARESGTGFYDRFRGRVMFPIRDLRGRVVAFGGRDLGSEEPKYLNSPETPLYVKGNLLYAADVARESMRAKNRALLVEGYVDCVMAHQYGFTETVAVLGTAFTATQLGVLRRHCDEIVTFFDADAAGQKAAERAEELLDSTSTTAWSVNRSGPFEAAGTIRLKAALLPAGHDPDTFLRTHGAPAFAERIRTARGLLFYALDRAIGQPTDGSGPRARAQAFARVALMLAKVSDGAEAVALSREAAARLGVDPTQLWIEAQKLSSALRKPSTPAVPPAISTMAPAVEKDLVALLLNVAAARAALLSLVEPSDLAHEPLAAIVAALKRRPEGSAEALMPDLPDDAARSVLAALLIEERPPVDPRMSIEQFGKRLDRKQRLRRMRDLSRSIAEAQTRSGAEATVHDELRTLERESKEVYELSRAIGPSITRTPEGPEGAHPNE